MSDLGLALERNELRLREIIDNARQAFAETHVDDEARCRAMAAHLREVDGLIASAPAVTDKMVDRAMARGFRLGLNGMRAVGPYAMRSIIEAALGVPEE